LQNGLLAIREDTRTKALAIRYAEDPDLADDALQSTYYAVARHKNLDQIENLRAYFCKVLLREVNRLRTRQRVTQLENPDGPEEPRQHGASARSRAPTRPIDEPVSTAPQARASLERFAAQRDHLRAAVPPRSGDPNRYRNVIVTVAEQVLCDAIHREPSEADSNDAFRAAYPEWFGEPGCTENTCRQRFQRARADMRALLRAVVHRDELLL
jgi:DNA-directed RNA polymerase specialized sigma24 family protein